MANNDKGKAFLVKYGLVLLFLDVIFAGAIATLNTTISSEAAGAFGFSTGGSVLIAILTWGLTFVFGLVFGGIFLTVFSVFGGLLLALLFGKEEKSNPPGPGPDNPCLLDPNGPNFPKENPTDALDPLGLRKKDATERPADPFAPEEKTGEKPEDRRIM